MKWDIRLPTCDSRLKCRSFTAGSLLGTGVLGLALLAGCESSSGSDNGDVQARQDSALKDPFSYGPSEHDPKKAPSDASRGKMDDGTIKGDWDRIWNP